MRVVLLSLWLALVACGSVDSLPPVEPPPVEPPPRVLEIVPAAGRLSGGAWTVDVQFGTTINSSRTTGGSWTVRGGTPLSP